MDGMQSTVQRWLLALAVAGSAITAILYVLVGLGALDIGEPAPGVVRSLTTFGLSVGAAYALIALLLLRVHRRWVWLTIALLNAIVIWIYFATSTTRVPAFALPGVLINALQAVTLVAVVFLAILGWGRTDRPR
jgi:hypothetical protein